ncbi:MAG: hypothetical protein GC158_04320 [Cyanobacteria bacterium RI_101]|nr:hypothetical protein [Cyanobacteria bacterium RI_101]
MAIIMNSTPAPATPVWQNLQQAIAATSGFKCWQDDQSEVASTLESQVRRYLRQTLETLAY